MYFKLNLFKYIKMELNDYQELILQHRPALKPNSAKTYAVSLKSLSPKDSTNFGWLDDVDYVLSQLEKYKDTTRKNVLNAVIVVSEKDGEPFKRYTTERDKYNEKYAELTKAHKKTESQEKNWVDWPDYQSMVSEMKEDVKDLKGKDWSWREKQRFQDYVIALLYSFYPLRNDFADVKIVNKKTFNNTTTQQREEQNYLMTEQNGHKMSLILNEYKTSKKYGEKTIELNTEVKKALRKWLQHNDSGYLLTDKHGKALGSNGITKSLARVGQRRLGKSLGSSLLRHSYLSDKYKDINEEKQKDADLMGHSVEMQDGYIKE